MLLGRPRAQTRQNLSQVFLEPKWLRIDNFPVFLFILAGVFPLAGFLGEQKKRETAPPLGVVAKPAEWEKRRRQRARRVLSQPIERSVEVGRRRVGCMQRR